MKRMHARAEQRNETREDIYAGQLFVVDLHSERSQTQGIVLNICPGGLAVQALRSLVTEEETTLSFSGVTCKGKVVWQKQGGLTGIRFLDAPFKDTPFKLPELPRHPDSLPLAACLEHSAPTEFESTLHLLAQSAMTLTGASGVAIAVGNEKGMECRASVGSAPEIGTTLAPDSGLSGESLRTGAIILCKDARVDSRVNPSVAQQTDTRSIMIVPVIAKNNMLGVFEAFSPNAAQFDEGHLQQLQPFVSVIANAIQQERKQSENHVQSPQAIPTSVIADTFTTEATEGENLEYITHEQRRTRLRTILTLYIVAALLVFLGAVTWFTSRSHTAATQNASSQPPVPDSTIPPSTPTSVLGSALQPEISFVPPVINQKTGETFGVDVVLKGARNLKSAPFQILYDPRRLQVITVTNGSLLDRDGQAATFVQRVDSDAGRINVSISRPSDAPGVSGDGIVFTLVFLSKAAGSSKIRVDQARLRDATAKVLSVKSSEAVVTISSSSDAVAPGEQDGLHTAKLLPPAMQSPENLDIGNAARLNEDKNEPSPSAPWTPRHMIEALPKLDSPAQSAELRVPPLVSPATTISQAPVFELERTLKGHTNWVTTVAFSANGRRLISGSWDKSVKLWDVDTGGSLSTIAKQGAGLQTIALSHDGSLVATEDAADDLTIWSASTGKEIRTVKGDRPPWDYSWVYSIAFSPDDRMLASAFDNSTVQLVDVSSGRVIRKFKGRPRAFIYASFSPDGRLLATGGDTKTIDIWDVTTGKLMKTLAGHKQDIYAAIFSPDGRWLASVSKDKTARLWDVSTGHEVHTLSGHQNIVTSLAFSLNSRWLASSSWDKTIKIWDVEAGREVQTLTGNTHQVYSIAFDSHRGSLATGSADGTIRLWRLRKDINLAVLNGESGGNSTAVASTGHP